MAYLVTVTASIRGTFRTQRDEFDYLSNGDIPEHIYEKTNKCRKLNDGDYRIQMINGDVVHMKKRLLKYINCELTKEYKEIKKSLLNARKLLYENHK